MQWDYTCVECVSFFNHYSLDLCYCNLTLLGLYNATDFREPPTYLIKLVRVSPVTTITFEANSLIFSWYQYFPEETINCFYE